jgi:hypothetical protein
MEIEGIQMDIFDSDDFKNRAYKQELRRGISPLTSFTLCFTNAAIIPALFF